MNNVTILSFPYFHDFRRVGPRSLSFTHRHLGSQVLPKNICIPFGLRNWFLGISGNLLKVLVPLGVKFGGEVSKSNLKDICLGAKIILWAFVHRAR
jgi:hypothetical protein